MYAEKSNEKEVGKRLKARSNRPCPSAGRETPKEFIPDRTIFFQPQIPAFAGMTSILDLRQPHAGMTFILDSRQLAVMTFVTRASIHIRSSGCCSLPTPFSAGPLHP